MFVLRGILTAMTHMRILSKALVSIFLVIIFGPWLLAQKTADFPVIGPSSWAVECLLW